MYDLIAEREKSLCGVVSRSKASIRSLPLVLVRVAGGGDPATIGLASLSQGQHIETHNHTHSHSPLGN